MSKFKVGQRVIRTTLCFNDFKEGAPYLVTKLHENDYANCIEVEGFPDGTLWSEDLFELYQEPAQKTFIPAASNNPVVIPKQPQDLSFQVKALELENQMLRMLLRREGVEV